MNEQSIFDAIKADPQNASYTALGIDPLYSVHPEAKLLIVGQAPGTRAEKSGVFWDDPSGDRLRDWMGISRETFYNSPEIAILPLDFYFPGKGKSGDLAPRKGFADKWHPQLLEQMPHLETTLLIGSYAQKYYLKDRRYANLTETVQHYQEYLPQYFPLVHPSPRNQIWMKKNPWFSNDVIPELKEIVHALI
ncbi:uracil-DNA glycosylase [Weissella uvarum]|uniref:uracil-DNA glycosylase family protein n=1 Tax=Weissella uvarum TaxID=1479233 RepID=UPI001961683C|nr:uracil-DNA glycosylase family protein [Weissella uvarum]MBM7617969.1 uracil-DNA glycosylase [Weissella uvarum]MCM0596188.1 uracil-DNA glycosylase family protein [Weissella uvarum]